MDLIPENVEGAVVLNVTSICVSHDPDCRNCVDIGGAVHNWLLMTGIKYVVIDFQDEKDICSTFIVELLQLRKRLNVPFLFAGVTSKPKQVLESYDYFKNSQMSLFVTPDEAVMFLKKNFPSNITEDFSNVKFGEPVTSISPRHSYRPGEGEEVVEGDTDTSDFE